MSIFKEFLKELLNAASDVNQEADNTDPFRPDDYNQLPIDPLHDSVSATARKEFWQDD